MIQFNNLRVGDQSLAEEIRTAVVRVLERGWYVLGPEVDAFEAAFAAEAGIKTGARKPDQAMEFLTAELYRLFGGQMRPSGRVSP